MSKGKIIPKSKCPKGQINTSTLLPAAINTLHAPTLFRLCNDAN